MADTQTALRDQLAVLQCQVEALLGLRTVVEEQREEIKALRALLDSKESSGSSRAVTQYRPADEWREVAGRRKGKSAPPASSVLETRNSFSVLRDQCSGDGTGMEIKTDETTLSKGKIILIGDSQVRGQGRLFCARDAERRMCVCLPGAGVGDVVERLDGVLKGEGFAPTVCISAGGNDIGRVRSDELFRRYRQALGRVRDLGGTPVLCGILPRKFVDAGWWSEAAALNSRLADHCRRNGWLFVDNWNYFYGKDHLYSRDGVHLSQRGSGALAWSLQRDLQEWGFLGRV